MNENEIIIEPLLKICKSCVNYINGVCVAVGFQTINEECDKYETDD